MENNKIMNSELFDNVVLNNVEPANVRKDKNIYKVLHFSSEEFYNKEKFFSDMMWGIKLENEYSLLARVWYSNREADDVEEYKMLGNQVGLNNRSSYDDLYDWFVNYYKTIDVRLEISMDKYKYVSYDIYELQFIIYIYGDTVKQRLVKFRKDSLGVHKDLINVSKISEGFNQLLPLTYDKERFGILLNKNIVNNSVNTVNLIDGDEVNVLELINSNLVYNKKLVNIASSIDFYQKNVKGSDILILVESFSNRNNINVYNIKGMLICKIVDVKLSHNSFTRQIGNVKSYINDTGMYRRDITIDFPHVYPAPYKGRQSGMLHPEWRIGTLDIETYVVDKNCSKAYAIGFYADNKAETFYINEDLDSDLLIIECIGKMLNEKYNGYTFYVHNLAKYDSFYLIPVLIDCVNLYPNKYNYKFIFRDDYVIGIKISAKISNKTISIRIVDSYTILAASLDKLCKTFNTDVRKSIFPYDFINKHNLFYLGNKPDIKFFKVKVEDKFTGVVSEEIINNSQYNSIRRDNWSVKEETLRYLENDLISLYEVVQKFRDYIFIKYRVHITDSLTISGLTMNVFLRKYYNKSNNIPLIKQKSVYNNIKKSYYGGITEVYKPHGFKLYLYDVNSLYPFAALNTMPGLKSIYTDNINKNFCELEDNIFGFFYCKITAPNNYLGLLPYKINGGLVSPVGIFEGWYFSEELRFAFNNGYDIQILSGYQFDKSENVFDEYVKDLYEIKSTTDDPVIKAITKSFLNNLLGRWGLNINKYITRIISEDEFQFIMSTRIIRSFKYIKDKVLVTYDKEISKDICESHNLDYAKVLTASVNSVCDFSAEHDKFNDVSVAIASAITSYARVYMNKVKLDILDKGGKLFYTDTDSIVTDIKLDDNLVGNNIGQFKLVHIIDEGYFISNKSYALKTTDGKTVIKCKGFLNRSLNFESFIEVYKGNVVEGKRYESKKDYSNGVILNIKDNLKLSPFSYTKRVKVLNSAKLWVDTKPININTNNSMKKEYHTISFNLLKWKDFIIGLVILSICILALIISFLLDESLEDDNIFMDDKDILLKNDNIPIEDKGLSCGNKNGSFIADLLYDFYKLFKHDHINKYKLIDSVDTHLIEHPQEEDKLVHHPQVMREVLLEHLKSQTESIDDLNDKLSMLQEQLRYERMITADTKELLDTILKDLKIASDKSRSPILNKSPVLK